MKRSATLAMTVVLAACATSGEARPAAEPITLTVDNMSNVVVTVERYVGGTVTQRVGLVPGASERVMTIPWHSTRLAHQLLRLDAGGTLTYDVEECRNDVCAVTQALHLPPGAEVSLVIDRRRDVRMYYEARDPPQ